MSPQPDSTVAAADEPVQGPAEEPAAPPADDAAAPARRRRRRVRWGTGLAVVGLAGTWWLGWMSPVTLVEHVVVRVPAGIDEEQVRLASGISAADHVPAVDARRVRAAVMADIPAVADVAVARSLPSTITLTVRARRPLAVVAVDGGYRLMDEAGVVYDAVDEPGKLPVVQARSDRGREAARQVLATLPRSLWREVGRISAGTRDDVTLRLRDGATVRWGSAEQAELKARVLAGLVVVGAARYDVSAPLLPTTSGSLPGS